MPKYLLAAAALTMMSTSAWATNLVTKGGFEDPAISDPCCDTSPPAPLPGWTATPNVNVVNGTFSSTNGNLAAEGSQYLDLVGQGGTGSITQTFATNIGDVYYLTFDYSHNLFNPAVTSASAMFTLDGLSGTIFHDSGSTSNLDWTKFFGTFTATGSSATLTFTNLTGGTNEGIFLDAVSVQAVPEPATWMMMILGFGAIGGAMRTSRRKRATVSYA